MSNMNKFHHTEPSSFKFCCALALLHMVVTSAKETEEILKSSKLTTDEEEVEQQEKTNNTRELFKKAREAANEKFSKNIVVYNVQAGTENNKLESNLIDEKIVLKGQESPAFHGQLVKMKLKRIPDDKPVNINPKSKQTQQQRQQKLQQQQVNSITTAPPNRSLFEYFKLVRREYEDFREIEAVRLQKRLEKFSDFPKGSKTGNFEEFEKEIVPWQCDSSANSCYACSTNFTLINRRHHCRLCGKLICSDCLRVIPIKLEIGVAKELKSCTKCHKFLFKKAPEFPKLSASEIKMNLLFKRIKSLREQLLETIPRFNEYLLEESVTKARPLKEWKQDAWALRDILILYSVHFRSTIQELAEVAEVEALENPIFKVFSNNLKRSGNEFLQKHMFTLQILDLSKKEPVVQTISSNDKSSGSSSPSGFVKKIVPSVLNELFKVTSSSENGMLELYTDEGDLLSLADPNQIKGAIDNQVSILEEQLNQLKMELSEPTRSEDEKDSLNRAIEDLKMELNRLQRIK